MSLKYYLVELKNSYLIIPIAIIIVLLLNFIFNKVYSEFDSNNHESNSVVYIKLILSVVLTGLFSVYINNIQYNVVEKILTTPPVI